MQHLIEKLHALRAIAPSDEFHSRSFATIVSSPQLRRTMKTRLMESMNYSLALGLMAVTLIVAAGGASYLGEDTFSPVIVGSLNAKSLSAEAESFDAQLGLVDARYFTAAAKDVAVALDAVAKDAPDHLNERILEQELKRLDLNGKPETGVDELLNAL